MRWDDYWGADQISVDKLRTNPSKLSGCGDQQLKWLSPCADDLSDS